MQDANFAHFGNGKNDLYLSEFEILDMSGHDGRLQNGACCSGQRPSSPLGFCKGGNTTCLPYWRICIVEMTPDMIGPVFASREASGSGSSGTTSGADILNSGSPLQANTTKKPGMISSFFSKYGYCPLFCCCCCLPLKCLTAVINCFLICTLC